MGHYPTTLPHLQRYGIMWTPNTALYRGSCVYMADRIFILASENFSQMYYIPVSLLFLHWFPHFSVDY